MMWRRGRSLSFRSKLTLSFAGLALVVITGVAVTLTSLSNRQAAAALRDKATRYATLIAPQLRTVVAFDDKLTSREVFASFASDSDVTGLAVYRADGRRIDGFGIYPETLAGTAGTAGLSGQIVVLTPVASAEGPRGTLYVSISAGALEQQRQRSAISAITIGIGALGVALLAATLLARPVAKRVAIIADTAGRVAQGNLDEPEVDPGADDEIGHLARAFNVMVAELRRQFLERAQLAATEQARLESVVATRTHELEESREQYRLVAESTNAIPFTYLLDAGQFSYVGPQAEKLLAHPLAMWREPGFLTLTLLPPDAVGPAMSKLQAPEQKGEFEFECTALAADGRRVQLRWVVTPGQSRGERCLHGLILDISEQRRLERELAQAQKLESVGRLAAGVAHEINTPVQFVSDSMHFVRDSMADVATVMQAYRRLHAAVVGDEPTAALATEVADAERDADIDYTLEHMPKAIDRSLDGLERVTTIVRSMKDFAHPDEREMNAIDINQSIQSTLIIARNEYKYVAEVETAFGELPPVVCHAGDINQAVLNVVVNAAHAIGDIVAGTDQRGHIRVSTRADGDCVEIRIADSGGGIPEAIRNRIFDPFFTTKAVGKGTGQGLAIARSVITEKHGGEFTFETELGVGTTFVIRLPIEGAKKHDAIVAA
jgi:signal transduction histidine kinase